MTKKKIRTTIKVDNKPIHGGEIEYEVDEQSGGFLGNLIKGIPILGPLIGKLFGSGTEGGELDTEVEGGFIQFLPAILSGVSLLSDLLKGNGFTKEAQICGTGFNNHKISFEDDNGNEIFGTNIKINPIGLRLLKDPEFIKALHAHKNGNGTSGLGTSGMGTSGLGTSGMGTSGLGTSGMGFENYSNINQF